MEMNENNSFSSNNNNTATWKKKKNKNKNKKSFSDEQIKLLESMFESETKPDPRKKVMLAKELGLQPRQVAIWFQNRRARWKSKQVEQDFRALKAKYDNLMNEFECLKKEKHQLETELQKLNEVLDRTQEGNRCSRELEEQGWERNSADGEHNNRETEAKPIDQQDDFVQRLIMSSHEDDKSSKSNNSREERCEILTMGGGEEEQEVGALGLPGKWDYSGSSCTSDYSFSNSQAWWNLWT